MARAFRFAPSPNGRLHLGHALSAILNAEAARACSGRFLVRIEDIDASRARPKFERLILDDLAWLGLSWEEPVARQSERLALYQSHLAELDRLGLVYPSFLSRSEIAARVAALEAEGAPVPRDPDGAPLYPGGERDWPPARRRAAIEAGAPYVLRLDMARALAGLPALSFLDDDGEGGPAALFPAEPRRWGDVALARRDAPASYHLAVVADDADQGVTDVTRGEDLRPATSVHRLLQTLLGLPEPRYHHHRLIRDGTGAKLSKSRGSESLAGLRAAGAKPADVRRLVGL